MYVTGSYSDFTFQFNFASTHFHLDLLNYLDNAMQVQALRLCLAGGCPQVGELLTAGDLVAIRLLRGSYYGVRHTRLVPVILHPFRASVESVGGATGANNVVSTTCS